MSEIEGTLIYILHGLSTLNYVLYSFMSEIEGTLIYILMVSLL